MSTLQGYKGYKGYQGSMEQMYKIGHPIIEEMNQLTEAEVLELMSNNGGRSSKKSEMVAERDLSDPLSWSHIVPGPLDNLAQERLELDDVNGFGALYGPEALEAYSTIDDFLVSLEECDEALLDIISQCYNMLTRAGQNKLATEGIS